MTIERSTNTGAQQLTNQTLNLILTLIITLTLLTKQHAIVNIKLNIVTCPTHPEKFIRDNVVAPLVPTSSVIVTTVRVNGVGSNHGSRDFVQRQ